MYIINITVNPDLSPEQHEKMFPMHEDCYYPDFARYEIREFAPKLISEKLPELAGK
jgi:hypothetical protein